MLRQYENFIAHLAYMPGVGAGEWEKVGGVGVFTLLSLDPFYPRSSSLELYADVCALLLALPVTLLCPWKVPLTSLSPNFFTSKVKTFSLVICKVLSISENNISSDCYNVHVAPLQSLRCRMSLVNEQISKIYEEISYWQFWNSSIDISNIAKCLWHNIRARYF